MNAPSSEPVPVLLTRQQVAHAWGISVATVDKLVASAQVPSIRIGRARRIPANFVCGIAETSRREDETPLSESQGAAVD